MSDTPETDAAVVASGGDWSPVLRAVSQRLERERDKAIRQLDNLNATAIHSCHNECQRPMCVLRRERDETLAQIKELIYIADRAIDLAEIDFENDKFGVVSELRSDLEKIKELNHSTQNISKSEMICRPSKSPQENLGTLPTDSANAVCQSLDSFV